MNIFSFRRNVMLVKNNSGKVPLLWSGMLLLCVYFTNSKLLRSSMLPATRAFVTRAFLQNSKLRIFLSKVNAPATFNLNNSKIVLTNYFSWCPPRRTLWCTLCDFVLKIIYHEGSQSPPG